MRWILVVLLCLACHRETESEKTERLIREIGRDLANIEVEVAFWELEQTKFAILIDQRERHKMEVVEALRSRQFCIQRPVRRYWPHHWSVALRDTKR